MILLIDIGNSNICFALHNHIKITCSYRIKSFLDKSSDEYYLLFQEFIKDEIEDIIISSVVPTITSAIVKMSLKYYNIQPKVVGQGIKTGLKIIADDPKSVGADLICDVIGASLFSQTGLVIDLGTASKIMYYKDHTFMSCLIAPGVATSTKAMTNKAALLPNFELNVPKKILNNSTIPCMQSGVLYGFASMVDGLILRIKKEINQENICVIATGGLISLIAPLCYEKINIIEPNLVLLGLYEIYLKNK
ncbi:MAG: type III pantothenate kinase [Erysipelotrichaceae bacterium]|nr:type III pantothenate kinase [Erysipelotrichaceae bacterium]